MFQCFSPLVCLSPIYYVYSPHGLKRQTCRGRNKKIFIMDLKTDFETYWALFKPDAQFENRMDATRIEWDACAPDKQQAIIAWLRKHGAYRGRNPYFFIQDFRVRQPKQQVLSYDAYYTKYGTTLERDGWKMTNPTGNQVIYVKN